MEGLLERIGLTRGESLAYSALLESGESTAGRIARKAGVSQSKIYDIMERLCSMGLAARLVKSGRLVFVPSEPGALRKLLEEKRSELERQSAGLDRLMPRLEMLNASKSPKNQAMVYEGYQAVRSYFYKTLEGEPSERLVFGARTGYPVSRSAQWFFRNYHRQRMRKGGRLRIILNSDLREGRAAKYYEGMRLARVRYLPQVTFSSMGIEGGAVDMLVWSRETVVLFVIKSREVARTFRGYFELLWKDAGT